MNPEVEKLLASQAGREPFGNGFFIFLAIMSLFIGAGIAIAGWRFRQIWMMFWGAGLFLAGVALIIYVVAFSPIAGL